MLRRIDRSLLVVALVLVVVGVYTFNQLSTPTVRDYVEVTEYQGERLSSISEFRENSIKGPQTINVTDYRLSITGLVENQTEYTYSEVLEGFTGVAEVEKAYGAYKDADKEAQAATEQCKKEFKKLQDWIRVFQDACRIVLKENSQLLEKVGILVRSAKPRKKEEGENEVSDDGSSDMEQAEAA